MRILAIGNMYPPHHLGGYELTWRAAMEHLRATGHDPVVLTTDYRHPDPDPGTPEDPDVHRELRWYWHEHDWPRLSLRGRVALERHNGRVLERLLRESRPEVVNWWAMGGMSLSLLERVRLSGLPSVGVVGDDWMVYGPKVDAWLRLAARIGPLGRLAGLPTRFDPSPIRWLFNSETTRRHALDEGLAVAHAEVVHPGVDTDLFREAPEHDWNWRLLYVGRIDERKGIDAAVDALARLPDQARLTVLGSGDEGLLAELRARCGRLGINGQVEFGLRPRDQLPAAYARADALLFPVRWEEPWGLVPLEAMATGTPVVATATGGAAEYLRDGDNALVVDSAAHPEQLAEAVGRLAGDPGLRGRLRRGGLETAAGYSQRAYNEAIAAALERAAAA